MKERFIFANNPDYKLEFESSILKQKVNGVEEPLRFYAPVNIADGYHLSRYIAATGQNIYSAAGCTPDLLKSIADNIIDAVNRNKIDEVAVWANNIKYRTAYPVDENAALRMAAIFYFVDGEDPDTTDAVWTDWKTKQMLADPEAYSFFLSMGLASTPAYSEYLLEISPSSLEQRREALKALTPIQ